ncbi:hypothetical protein GBAR_LOCUS14186, partial [Geodia barretti]
MLNGTPRPCVEEEKGSAGVPCLLISGTVGMITLYCRRMTTLTIITTPIKTCAM